MYCGCGTAKNKTLWCTWLLFLALFIASWIVWPIFGSRCVNEADARGCSTGTRSSSSSSSSTNDPSYVGGYDNQCVYEISDCKTMAAFFYLGILFAILSLIPLFIMCCCSRPPQAKHHQAPVAHTAYGGQQGTYGQQSTYADGYAGQPAAAYGQPAGTYNNSGYGNDQYGNTYGNAPYGNADYGRPQAGGQPAYGSAV